MDSTKAPAQGLQSAGQLVPFWTYRNMIIDYGQISNLSY